MKMATAYKVRRALEGVSMPVLEETMEETAELLLRGIKKRQERTFYFGKRKKEDEHICKLMDDYMKLEERFADSEIGLKVSEAKASCYEGRMHEIMDEISAQKERNAKERKSAEMAATELDKAVDAMKKVRDQAEVLDAENSTLKVRIEELASENKVMHDFIAAYRDEIKEIKEKLDAERDYCLKQKAVTRTVCEERDRLEASLRGIEKAYEAKQEEAALMHRRVAELLERMKGRETGECFDCASEEGILRRFAALNDMKGEALNDMKGEALNDMKGEALNDMKGEGILRRFAALNDMKGEAMNDSKGEDSEEEKTEVRTEDAEQG